MSENRELNQNQKTRLQAMYIVARGQKPEQLVMYQNWLTSKMEAIGQHASDYDKTQRKVNIITSIIDGQIQI